jgi:hypothetical protein
VSGRDRQRELEAYRRRIQELRAEQVELANAQGEQLTLPGVELAQVVDLSAVRRRRGWVRP